MDRDELFDIKVKKKLSKEVEYIPDNINKAFDMVKFEIISIKKKSYRKVASIIGMFISLFLLLSLSISPYAKRIPILRDINKYLTAEENLEYKQYGDDLNITVEDKGIQVTLYNVLYDGINLEVVYSVEVNGEVDEQFYINKELLIDGKVRDDWGQGVGGFDRDKGLWISNDTYRFLSKEFLPEDNKYNYSMPDKFLLSFKIDRIVFNKDMIVKGNWEIEVPIENKINKDNIFNEEIEIDLNNIQKDLMVNKFITTPINTLIQTTTSYKGNGRLAFKIFDEEGKEIESTGSSSYIYHKSLFKKGHYSIYMFDGIEDSKSVFVIPYIYRFGDGELPTELEVELNLKGKTELKTKDGKYYGEITKVEVSDNKTKLYYKPTTGNYTNLRIINNTNNVDDKTSLFEMHSADELATRYIKETGEFVIELDKALGNDVYNLVYFDYSTDEIVYYEKVFKIVIKK